MKSPISFLFQTTEVIKMNKNIGFIGAGKMAQAMIEGIVNSKIIEPEKIMASAATEKTRKKINQMYKLQVTPFNKEVAAFADILILAVKPSIHNEIIDEIRNDLKPNSIVVTIAAGITIANVESFFGYPVKVVRTMPNTPALVGEGMTVLCPNHYISETEVESVEQLLNTFGKSERLPEELMDAVPAISGSSPAYVYMLIEALADGGVRQGIPRDKAYRLGAQAVLGAARMVLETEKHPGELKDHVCTPGGATIEAVTVLEEKRFRGAVLSAMDSCTKKVKSL
jgi:pyrroline-5-carboxylate reductase